MPDSIVSTYPVDFERTAIAVGYSNRAYVADEVFPRVPVMRKEYPDTDYPLAESFTVPDTRIGRRGRPTLVHCSAFEKAGACEDYGLEDAIPDDDVRNAPPTAADPLDRSTMLLTDLLMVDREQRCATLAFNKDTYPAGSKVTLAGNDQWSADHANSDPIADILGAIEGMIVPPTHLLLGSIVWRHLRAHKAIVKAINRTEGDSGIASRQAVADLFELEGGIVVSQIGATPLDDYAEVTREWAPAGDRISLVAGNVDTTTGAALDTTDWIERAAAGTVRVAIDIAGSLFNADRSGRATRSDDVEIEIEHWPEGDEAARRVHRETLVWDERTPYRRTIALDLDNAVADQAHHVRLRRLAPPRDHQRVLDQLTWTALALTSPTPPTTPA